MQGEKNASRPPVNRINTVDNVFYLRFPLNLQFIVYYNTVIQATSVSPIFLSIPAESFLMKPKLPYLFKFSLILKQLALPQIQFLYR